MRRSVWMLVASLGWFVASVSEGAPVTWVFSGTVTGPDVPGSGLPPGMEAGQALSATITFESTTADSYPLDPNYGRYYGLISASVEVPAAGFVASWPPFTDPHYIEVFVAGAPPTLLGSLGIDVWPPALLEIDLTPVPPPASDALPLVPPTILSSGTLSWWDPVVPGYISFSARIDSIALPEPMVSLMLTAGALSIGLRRRRTRTRS